MAAVSAVMIQGGFLFYGIVGNVKIAVFRNGELIPLGTGHTVDCLLYTSVPLRIVFLCFHINLEKLNQSVRYFWRIRYIQCRCLSSFNL